MITNSDPELYAGFVEEVQGYLPLMRQSIDAVNQNARNTKALDEIHRLAHSIKGAAAMVGYSDLSDLAHWAENEVEQIAAKVKPWAGESAESIADAVDAIERLLLEPPSEPDTAETEEYSSSGEQGFSDDLPPEVMEAFKEESEEHLQNIGAQLQVLAQKPGHKQTLQSIRRSVHTLKGAAGMVGFRQVSQLSHRMEDLLDALYEGAVKYSAPIQPLLQTSFDTLEQMLRDPGTSRQAVLEELYQGYATYSTKQEGERETEQEASSAEAAVDERMAELAERSESGESDDDKKQQFVRVPITVLDDLVKLVSELVVNRTDFEQHLSRYRGSIGEIGNSVERLGKLSNKLDTDYEVLAMQGNNAGGGKVTVGGKNGTKGHEFDELEFDRYTEFHLLSRDLTETISDLGTAGSQLDLLSGDFDHYLKKLGRLTTDVQDKLLRVRLVPLSQVLSRLDRTVKVTAQTAGKLVDLTVEGDKVEIDKIILEDLIGPIEHLLRNCVGHGIETAEQRRAAGKTERGRVHLRAYHEGTQVVLQLSDDGRGMNPEVLRAAVVRLGFLSEAEAAELSTEDLFECVFQPGFTTAERVSEISGRGVGMDVVKTTVQNWKGSIQLESEVGTGTRFTIRLPLTLASTRALLVRTGGETYALPLGLVSQSLHATRQQIEQQGPNRVLKVDGKQIPLVTLAEKLGLPGQPVSTTGTVPVVVVRIGERQLALSVDQLLDAREVVVKTLGGLLRRIKGVSGATMMGDGSVVLILDPSSFLQETRKVELRKPSETKPVLAATPAAQQAWRVLIVDDSLSVRRVLTNFVKNNGWEPVTARDGQEAFEMLQAGEQLPDAVLLDVEMPRMTGYELLAALRAKARFQNLPIVMLTSRSSDKHRKKAFESGANDYLVKPYNEKTLVHTLKRVVKESRELTIQ